MLQQDAGDVQKKWTELQAVWDGYAGVTGEMGYGESAKTFAFLRDGRYLMRTKRGQDGSFVSADGHESVEYFDGTRKTTYDSATEEFTLEEEPQQKWPVPFLFLWGQWSSYPSSREADQKLMVGDGSSPLNHTGFVTVMDIPGGGSLVLRSRDMTPLYFLELVFSKQGKAYPEITFFPSCKPIRYQRHCDREVEWSLPPGAQLVDSLTRDR